MLKYATIKGYNNIGELPFVTHLYQWLETLETCEVVSVGLKLRKVIFISAYKTSPFEYWVGYLVKKRANIYLNLPQEDIDLEEVSNLLGEQGKRIEDLQEFLKDTTIFKGYEYPKRVETWKELRDTINGIEQCDNKDGCKCASNKKAKEVE